MTNIFIAKNIITMNPEQPQATHVATENGRIIDVGGAELESKGKLNTQFENKILMPGFIEGHAHTAEGTLWRYTYCGFYDRKDPNGKMWKGLKNLKSVIERLKDAEKKLEDDTTPLPAWQLDPIYFDNIRVNRGDLDEISKTRGIGIMHASGHIMNVNTKALELAGMMKTGIDHPGVPLGEDGIPTGELKGPEVMNPVGIHIGFGADLLECDEQGLRDFAKLCVRSGTTTVTDLAAKLGEESIENMIKVTNEEDFPVTIVPYRMFIGMTPDELLNYVEKIKLKSTERLKLGGIKVVADGSIQGFSARLKEPYHNGAENGLWYTSPEQMEEVYLGALQRGLQVHTHTNGDEATELAIVIMKKVLEKCPVEDHRFTLQHCQLGSDDQFKQMKEMNMCVNLFANHHFYWGDEHYRLTVGPERAERMNPCATALKYKVPMGIHSDAPITPLAPLFTAWCAVNRITASGRVLGEKERISVQDALYAITMGAAYTLKLENEIGSIEKGKKADFVVLEDDPTTVKPSELKDVKVWGTIQNERIFEAKSI